MTVSFRFDGKEVNGEYVDIEDGFIFVSVNGKLYSYNLEYISNLQIDGKPLYFFFVNGEGDTMVPVNIREEISKLMDSTKLVILQKRMQEIEIDSQKKEAHIRDVVNENMQLKDEIARKDKEISMLKEENQRLREELNAYINGTKMAENVRSRLEKYESEFRELKRIFTQYFPSAKEATEENDVKQLYAKMLELIQRKSDGGAREVKREVSNIKADRTTTGVMQFDKILGGGLTYGNFVLVTFENFTGGDLLLYYLIKGGLEKNERVVIVLNGIREDIVWKQYGRMFDVSADAVQKDSRVSVIEIDTLDPQVFLERLYNEIDGFVNMDNSEARMLVYTVETLIGGMNYFNFSNQFKDMKFNLEGKKKNIFFFLNDYPGISDNVQKILGIFNGIIEFKKFDMDAGTLLRLRVQGLTSENFRWLNYEIIDNSFNIQSPNVRRI